jgi:hypothetical protein
MPCYDSIAKETALSLALMSFRIGHKPPDGLEFFGIEYQSSSNLPEIRHTLAKRALQIHQATHILWVDSDMDFPQDSLHRLLAHDLEIVGCNYPRRMPPHFSSATDLDKKPFHPSCVGLSQAGVIGFGLLLMRTTVFERQYDMPLFAHHDDEGYCTEDVTFCKKVRAQGHEIWIDHDLSREVRHIGSISLGHEHMEART